MNRTSDTAHWGGKTTFGTVEGDTLRNQTLNNIKRLENAKEVVTPTGSEVERDSDHSKRLGNAKEVVTPTGIEPIASV